MRGFEKFTEGRPFYEMPAITARICGICPISHSLASVKACGRCHGSADSRDPAFKLRELLHFGQFVQSHALSFFHLSSPDLLLGFDSDPAHSVTSWACSPSTPEIAKDGIQCASSASRIIERLAKERIHPILDRARRCQRSAGGRSARSHSARVAPRQGHCAACHLAVEVEPSIRSPRRSLTSANTPTMNAGLVDAHRQPPAL